MSANRSLMALIVAVSALAGGCRPVLPSRDADVETLDSSSGDGGEDGATSENESRGGTGVGIGDADGGAEEGTEDGGEGEGGAGDGGESQDGGANQDGGVNDAGSDAGVLTNWFPGHYVLLASNERSVEVRARDRLLAPAQRELMAPFAGIHLGYPWAESELSRDDYSQGFAMMDEDLEAVARAGKKIIISLSYKTFAGDSTSAPPDAVPAYLKTFHPSRCVENVYPDGGHLCGQYPMSAAEQVGREGNGAMIWLDGVSLRLRAWLLAMARHASSHPRRNVIAGFTLQETAFGQNSEVTLQEAGYTQQRHLDAIKTNAAALRTGAPNIHVFQFINFFPPNNQRPEWWLEQYANWALDAGSGVGCPDVSPVLAAKTNPPPGYSVLLNSNYQGRLPFAVGVQYMNCTVDYTTSLAATYDLAVNRMKAQHVSWFNAQNSGGNLVFNIFDVSNYIRNRPFPNTARPTY